MSPTARTALLVAACAGAALLVPPVLAALAALAVVVAAAVDARLARRPPGVRRRVPAVLSRGVPAPFAVEVEAAAAGRVRVRQPATPDVAVQPSEADDGLAGVLLPRRRGRHLLAPPATRLVGPLGLGRWDHGGGEPAEVLVYPDLAAARRLAVAVRTGRFREPGRRSRGPLGLGTDFELIREYVADDDIRQVNWRATARMGRPMSNQYRVEQDRDVVCVVDTGRLMAAPSGASEADTTRLDTALDALAAVALVADEVGDRCGAVAFDAGVRRRLAPRRRGGARVVHALFDLEPAAVDSDYELAFRTVGGTKRAFVLVLTDLLEEAAARPLVEAVPVLARRHAVVVASAADPDLGAAVSTPPTRPLDVYAAAVAVEVVEARARVASQLRRAGAEVVDADPASLGAACVSAYLRTKARGRL